MGCWEWGFLNQNLSVTISNLNSTCPKSLWVSSLVCDKRHWSPFRQGPERWGPSTRKGQKSAEYLVFLGFPQINKSYCWCFRIPFPTTVWDVFETLWIMGCRPTTNLPQLVSLPDFWPIKSMNGSFMKISYSQIFQNLPIRSESGQTNPEQNRRPDHLLPGSSDILPRPSRSCQGKPWEFQLV